MALLNSVFRRIISVLSQTSGLVRTPHVRSKPIFAVLLLSVAFCPNSVRCQINPNQETYLSLFSIRTLQPVTKTDQRALGIVQQSLQAQGGSSLWLSVTAVNATITTSLGNSTTSHDRYDSWQSHAHGSRRHTEGRRASDAWPPPPASLQESVGDEIRLLIRQYPGASLALSVSHSQCMFGALPSTDSSALLVEQTCRAVEKTEAPLTVIWIIDSNSHLPREVMLPRMGNSSPGTPIITIRYGDYVQKSGLTVPATVSSSTLSHPELTSKFSDIAFTF